MIDFTQKYVSYLKKLKQSARKEMVPLDFEGEKFIIKDCKKYINFSSNDYLSLRTNSLLKQESINLVKKYGVGSGGSRFLTGNIHIIDALEKKISDWKGAEESLIMNSGYQLNSSVLPALFNENVFTCKPTVFIDKNVHASIYDGCLRSKINLVRFQHNDLDHLERIISNTKWSGAKFVITESLFSMNGTMPDLEKLSKICLKKDAFLIVDEAHAIGVFGEKGRGLACKANITIGTFGKAFGSQGAFLTCSKKIKQYLVATCRGLIYTTAPSPAILGSISAALDLVPKMEESRKKIYKLAQYFKKKLNELNLSILSQDSHIISIVVKDESTAYLYQDYLRDSGFWVKAIFPPTVSRKNICLRFTICAFHEIEDIDRVISSFCYLVNKND